MIKTGVGADKSCIRNNSLCGGANSTNVTVVDVKDGKLLRSRPLKYNENYTDEELKLWHMEKDGKVFAAAPKTEIPPFALVYKKRYTSTNRILYPMKRVDWSPENRNPQNRGTSQFVRISWDEALDIIHSEITRQFDVYGPGSVLLMQDGHGETKSIGGCHGCCSDLMEILGGMTVQARNPDSWEGWYWGAKHVWCEDPIGLGNQTNLIWDITQNSKQLLVWGGDPDTTPWGWGGFLPSRCMFWFTEIGIRQIYISPDLNYAGACHSDKWIPVYPNTDLALQFAIAYVWLVEGIYDKEYVKTHTIGFEYLEKHIMGQDDDGIVKTPEWAEPLCGVPARTIKALARAWHRLATTIVHGNGGSYIRSCFSHEPARMEVCLLAMQGLGAPGRNQFRMVEWGHMGLWSNVPMPRPLCIPNTSGCYHGFKMKQEPRMIPKDMIPKGIMAEEPFTWFGTTWAGFPREDQFIEYQFPANEDDPYIHAIWSDSPCWTTCWNGGNSFIQALRSDKLDFVMIQHPWLENDCLFADLLLPICTRYEEDDFGIDVFGGDAAMVYIEDKCVEARGESVTDWEAVCRIADKFGVLDQYLKGGPYEIEPLWRLGFEKSGVPELDLIDYDSFTDKRYFVIPTAEGWEEIEPGFYPFYKDPVANPLLTPSGLLEIYSEDLAEYFPDDDERRPYPHYIDESESHRENRYCDRAKDYPYLLVSNHPRWRVHANMDDIGWLREIETCKVLGPDGYQYEPIWVNPIDADKLGLKSGDVAKIYNERGWVLGGVYVTERIMPGTLSQDHGARLDPIEPGVSDRAGANNLICPTMVTSKNCAGEVTSGFLVGIEKVDVFELAKQYPEAFNRAYEPGYGPRQENRFKED